MKKTSVALISIALLLIGIAPIEAASPKNPYGTATIDPAAPNEIILTVSKGSRKAEFAYSRLLKMKHSTISIYEPFLKKRQLFTVIKLESLFTFVGIAGNDTVLTRALNDYRYSNLARKFLSANAYLAIKVNGEPIAYDQGGPIRLIYPDGSSWATNLDAWNWSLETIRVK